MLPTARACDADGIHILGPAADGGEIGVPIPKRISFSGLTTENLILSDIHANVFLSFPCFRAFLRGI